MLPDPHDLAIDAHKKIQNRLFRVRFRDSELLMSSLVIDYKFNMDDYDVVESPPDEEAAVPQIAARRTA